MTSGVSPLERATFALESQLEVLNKAREPYKIKLAYKKHLENKLIRDAIGKSHAERCVYAYASDTWESFSQELAKLEILFEHESLKFDVMKIDYQTKYLLMKETEQQIKRYR